MGRQTKGTIVLAVGTVFVIMLIAGCEEQNLQNTKRSRLVANENRLLKKQLKQTEKKLEQCLQEKKSMQEKAHEDALTPMTYVIGENQKLTEENEDLRAQIEQLKKEVEELKRTDKP